MPHCILEFSPLVQFKTDCRAFFKDLHEYMIGTGYFQARSIKSRIRRTEEVYLGDGTSGQSLIYLQISVLGGRPKEMLRELSNHALQLLQKHLHTENPEGYTSVTVEIREMDTELHSKQE